MHTAFKIVVLLAIFGSLGGWYTYSRNAPPVAHGGDTAGATHSSGTQATAAPNGKASSENKPIPVAIAHVRERSIPIYLDGLGTVQAYQNVTVRSQVEGRIDWGDFVEGSEVKKGQVIAQIDARTYQANYDQAVAKKIQDEAKQKQDQARISQDRAKRLQDEALEKQAEAHQKQNEAVVAQVSAKKTQDSENVSNSKLNLKRFEDSAVASAVSEQNVTDQRSQVKQLEASVMADEAGIQAANAAVQGDMVAIQAARAAMQGDDAAIEADEALVAGDAAMVKSDQAMVDYAKAILSYATITAPIEGRTGVRLIDQGGLLRTNETTGVIVITQLQPISVVFTLPQQYLHEINLRSAESKLKVLAVDSDWKTIIETGDLLLVDNQIDPTTGTVKLKATFKNEKRKLWPGGFVNMRLLLETREKAVVVSAPAVQQGPDGTFVFVIKADQTVELRKVKVWLVQDGKAIIEEGLAAGELVVRTGQDRLKIGSKVAPDKTEPDNNVKPAENNFKPVSMEKKTSEPQK